jgi:hypothetical protein
MITGRTENDQPTPIKLARRFLTDAAAFHLAAKELNQSDKPEVKEAPLQHYLECHALELILKSFILSSGGTEREVEKIRHDLCKAWTRAIELGLSPADRSDTETLIKDLAPYHRDHLFRYRKRGWWTSLGWPPSRMSDIIGNLIHQIGPKVERAYQDERSSKIGGE